MLTCLRIRDLAVISELELELSDGLHVITGETGAGKSILIAALQLILGGRAHASLIRHGASQAVVEAIFDLARQPALRERLQAFGADADDEVVVRRVIRPSGRSRAYINGTLATGTQLAALTGDLVDICSQHEHHRLAQASSHLGYLDAFAGLDAAATEVEEHFARWSEQLGELEQARARLQDRADREAMLRFHLQEVDALKPRAGELDELESSRQRLVHAERLAEGAWQAHHVLSESDRAVAGELVNLQRQLSSRTGLDPELDALMERLEQLIVDAEDLASEFGSYHASLEHDPVALAQMDDRIDSLRTLVRKHGGTLELVLARVDDMRTELQSLEDADGAVERLEERVSQAASALLTVARTLSDARRGAANSLGGLITTQLGDLGMGNALVRVRVQDLPASHHKLIDDVPVRATGMDHVEFLIAPNPGEPPKPLHRVASGGELSRSLLAVKRVLAEHGPRGLYVFDEVDTGVGGRIALAIGAKLQEVARHHQVLCISHQAQVAAFADHHIHVHKQVDDGRTHTAARVLAPEERTAELARMMGGDTLTPATLQAARDLLGQAVTTA